MKKWSANKNLIAIISLVVLVVVAAIGIGVGIIKSNQPKQHETVEKMNYTFYQSEPEFLDNHDDIGAMILDCDDESCFNGTLVNASFTSREGEYVQGKGALKISSFVHKSTVVTSGYFLSADISEFAKGSIHVSLYVSDTKYLGGDLIYELTSSGTFDKEEMAWKIPASVLESGWNELYLGIEDATITGGEPDLSKIKYFRMYGPGGSVGLDIIMDCVYATNTPGMSLEAKATGETASAKAGYLMDFDTLDGIKSSGTLILSTAKGEYKEGKGAVIISNPKVVWLTANLKTADLSAYKNGKLSFWVYINDASYVKDGAVTVELSSSGTFDKNEISWRLEGAKLKTGWNEVVLNMSEAVNSSTDKIDLTKVNYLRIFGQKCDENLSVILDAMRVLPPTKLVPSDGMILNCDTQENMIVTPKDAVSLTTVAGEYKEGTGAFKNTGSGIVWCQVIMQDLVDVSKYKDGGIHLWLYVSDASKLDKAVNIELGSGGKSDVDEYQWIVSGLNSGWNELVLDFESAIVTGNPDLSNVNYFRVFGKRNADITVMVDDVRAVEPEKASAVPGMIANCDSTRKLKLGTASLTTKEGEYKEGTGAYITSKASNLRASITLNNPVDISAYADGRLHLWLYVDNPDNIYKGFLVELGNDASNFYRWVAAPNALSAGWNELYLNFADANLKLGETNFAEIDYFRLLQYTSSDASVYKEMTTIVDDIRAVEAEKQEEKPVVPGMIADCDSTTGVKLSTSSVTTTEGQFKEGTGAYITSKASNLRTTITLNAPVDVSEYADGRLHLWLYVDNPDNIYKGFLVELGNDASNFYRWIVAPNALSAGWNELYLNFEDAYLKLGETNFAEIDYFRLLQYSSTDASVYKEMTTIVDDIRAVEAEVVDYIGDSLIDFYVDVEEGKDITVLQLSDTQIVDASQARTDDRLSSYQQQYWAQDKMDERCFDYIRETVENTNPDFIILTGDLVYGEFDDNGSALLKLIEVMDSFEIPWAPVFGNHDNESAMGVDWQCEQLENAQYCLFKQRELTGNGNYTVGITQGGELKRVFFMMDSNGCGNASEESLKNSHIRTAHGFGSDQIKWYTQVATKINEDYPDANLSFAFHIQIEAFEDAYAKYGFDSNSVEEGTSILRNPINIDTISDKTEGDFGYLGRRIKSTWDTDYSIWNSFKELGVDSIFVGHEHCNSASVVYDGIRCQYGQKTGTYDRANYVLADGSIEGSGQCIGDPLVGGTVTVLDKENGSIKDGYIYLADQENTVTPENGTILNCDGSEDVVIVSSNAFSVTTDGTLKSEGKGTVWWAVQFAKNLDVSAYAQGGLHVKLYVDDVSKLSGDVNIEVGSARTYDKYEYQWTISKESLQDSQDGWYELYLEFAKASKKDGGADLSKVNWFRVYGTCSENIVAMVDDVQAVLPEGTSSNVVIANCDNTDGIRLASGTGAITTTTGEFKEGTGAIKTTTNVSARAWIYLDEPVDISKYSTSGYLHFWFYIDDPAKITNLLIVDIGHDTSNMFRWTIAKGDLVSGWNDIYLPFAKGKTVIGSVDFSEINMFRVSQSSGTLQTMTTYTDDVKVMETLPGQVLANCDNTNGLTLQSGTGAITTTAGEFKEGIGAIKLTTSASARAWINWSEPVDIEKYVTNGYLHFWFYIDDPAKITNLLIVDIGHDTSNMFRWTIAKGNLVSGWNEILLPFAKGKTVIGTVDFSKINMFRVSQSSGTLQTMTTYTDDIRIVASE